MRLKEHFHWLVTLTTGPQFAGQMLGCAMLENFFATSHETLPKVELNILLSTTVPTTCLTMALQDKCNGDFISKHACVKKFFLTNFYMHDFKNANIKARPLLHFNGGSINNYSVS